MRAWFTESVGAFVAHAADDITARLALEHGQRLGGDIAAQIGAWQDSIELLQTALADAPPGWTVALEYNLLRLEKRIDAVLLTDRAILVLEFKSSNRHTVADLRDTEDYALDLHDFHAGSRSHPIVPVLVAARAPDVAFDWPLLWHGVTPPLRSSAAGLGALVRHVQSAIPAPLGPLDHVAWLDAAYRPVPTIIEAASMLFRRNSVAEIAAARAAKTDMARTTAAILRAIDQARADARHTVIFLTGIPGAGKTLCGMNVVFGDSRAHGAAFLTGNAPLVAVLKEVLVRNAMAGGSQRSSAEQATAGFLQNVHRFLEGGIEKPGEAPDERIIVFDEAQRAWDEAKARLGSLRRRSILTRSEPAHTLDIMGRHADWAVVVALIGNGQEINTGEAGLREWGRMIDASNGKWRAVAASSVLGAPEQAQRLADHHAPWLTLDDDLHLAVSVRSVRSSVGAGWVQSVLDNDAAAARDLAAQEDVPYFVTRDLGQARQALRGLSRGRRRAGLVASSEAKRLRAEGLGALLTPDETANWFLNTYDSGDVVDVRASDALEVPATEYACQGLEIDVVGLAWGGDLIRAHGTWLPRQFRATARGTKWGVVQNPTDREFLRNTYRVLLTRARYETIIWVPPGDDADPTRPRAEMDAIADYLLACGARPLEEAQPPMAAAAQMLL